MGSLIDRRVFVYRNIHTNCFSVRSVRTGLVIDHMESILLRDVQFVVGQAGWKRVVETGVKNVHAGCRGVPIDDVRIKVGQPIRYNHHKGNYFHYRCNGREIYEAPLVLMKDNKIYLAEEL